MKDGFTYSSTVKIPLISAEEQGLVDAQSYTDYLQPLLEGYYDGLINQLSKRLDGKVENDAAYSSVKHAADWCGKYILQGDPNHPFIKSWLDTESDSYVIATMIDGFTYGNHTSIPLISAESQGVMEYTAWDNLAGYMDGSMTERIDGLDKDKVGKTDTEYLQIEHSIYWLNKYVLSDSSKSGFPFLKFTSDEKNKTLTLSRLIDTTYVNEVELPMVDDTNNTFFDPFFYETYIQPLFNDEYALTSDVDIVAAKADAAEAKAEEVHGLASDANTLSSEAKAMAEESAKKADEVSDWKNTKRNAPDGWCALDETGKVPDGLVPDAVYEVHRFSGMVSLADGTIKHSSIIACPTDEGCSIVFDETTYSFCFRKKVGDEGDPDLDYEYYNNWPGASRLGVEWMNPYFMGWKPTTDNLYIDTDTSKAYYWDGSRLVPLAGSNGTSSGDGSGSGTDSDTLKMLVSKVEALQKEVDSLKDKLMMA